LSLIPYIIADVYRIQLEIIVFAKVIITSRTPVNRV